MNDPKLDAMALWLVEQQQQSAAPIAHRGPAGDLHLHQHHYAAPAPVANPEPEQPHSVRPNPLVMMFSLFLFSIAISVPLALLAAIVEATNRPSVQYVQPSGGGW
jgi:hypothetical protein